jgi:hypothetical protein
LVCCRGVDGDLGEARLEISEVGSHLRGNLGRGQGEDAGDDAVQAADDLDGRCGVGVELEAVHREEHELVVWAIFVAGAGESFRAVALVVEALQASM